jgi:hypothetical protein
MEKENPMDKNNARIFAEMRSADEIRSEMKANIIERMRNSGIGQALGAAYDSPLAQAIGGGIQDFQRRAVENAWYQKDIFDGRWNVDTRGPEGMQGMDRQYDHRASFYGWDQQKPSQDRNNDDSQGLSYSRGR